MTFWNVTAMTTPDDDGYCTTFDNEADARKLAAWLRGEGCWFVQVWKA